MIYEQILISRREINDIIIHCDIDFYFDEKS